MIITDFRIPSALAIPWLYKDMTVDVAHTFVLEVINLAG